MSKSRTLSGAINVVWECSHCRKTTNSTVVRNKFCRFCGCRIAQFVEEKEGPDERPA
jgi:hypothetical protein